LLDGFGWLARDVGIGSGDVAQGCSSNGRGDLGCQSDDVVMGQEMVSEGTEENKMLGQVWLVSSFKGEFGGEVFEGRGHVGYDPASKQYVGSWIDSMTPVATQMKGTYDPKTKAMTLQTKGVDMQGKPSTGTMTTVYQGTDKRTTTMHSMIDGKKVKVMEIVYQRAAGK